MSNRAGGRKRGYLIYICTIFFITSMAAVFLPTFGQRVDSGDVIFFNSLTVLIGGEHTAIIDGVVYSYSFSLNLPMLIILAFNASGVLFALSARNSPSRILGTLIIAICSLGFFVFSRIILQESNPSLTGNNFVLGVGYPLAIVSTMLCIAVAVLEYCLCRRYRRKQEAFR